jgi:hypothetical protein
MAKMKKFDFDRLDPVIEHEDEKTLPAIAEGVREAEADRTTPIEKVRKLLHKWVSPKF